MTTLHNFMCNLQTRANLKSLQNPEKNLLPPKVAVGAYFFTSSPNIVKTNPNPNELKGFRQKIFSGVSICVQVMSKCIHLHPKKVYFLDSKMLQAPSRYSFQPIKECVPAKKALRSTFLFIFFVRSGWSEI